jgi:REP element-mobilizing transposase RayT
MHLVPCITLLYGASSAKKFYDDEDRDSFFERLGTVLIETGTDCFAWALIPNHLHMLLKTGTTPIASMMRRLLTGYAVSFNRRHTAMVSSFKIDINPFYVRRIYIYWNWCAIYS